MAVDEDAPPAVLGYFIPGVRHFTAYAAGMSDLEPPQFALFAYSGAALWSASFIALGYFLGERWEAVQKNVHQYLIGLTIAAYARFQSTGFAATDSLPLIETSRFNSLADVALQRQQNGIHVLADQERIFDAFAQGDSRLSRTHSGTGLGLSLSRRLASLLGGELTVSSVVGAGSTFRLVLPLARSS